MDRARPEAAATLEADMARHLEPTAAEAASLQRDADDLRAACDAELQRLGLPGQATIQGSVAKGTWLAGTGDIDLFLLLDPSVATERLEAAATQVGANVLQGCQRLYAQHPYVTGTFRGRDVDLVPAYKVQQATARMSAVDRTPFHTAWVRAHLDEAGRRDVRLLKAWLKGTGCYGAETSIGGFSGYLAEVLVVALGSFRAVREWLERDATPRRITLGPDQVTDEVAPLVVVDPVDPARNCAAAVSQDVLERAAAAARAYHAAPTRRFYQPNPPRPEAASVLRAHQAQRGETWIGLVARPRTDRLDLVFPQFQKAVRTMASALGDAGFFVHRAEARASLDGREVLLHLVADGRTLSPTRLHRGPPADGRPHEERFRAKWTGHADAASPVRVGAKGELELDVHVRDRTAAQALATRLRPGVGALPLGKHVAQALDGAQLLANPAVAPTAWAPAVADLVLGRQPWER